MTRSPSSKADTPEPAQDRRTILQLDGVSKIYRTGEFEVKALDDVTFQVNGGEMVAVMGPSGSGKTTLLTIAGALVRPTVGQVHVCGIDVSEMSEGELAGMRRTKVGFIYQSFNLLEALSALENVMIVSQNHGHDKQTAGVRAKELLEMFGLGHRMHALPKKLSDGEKQRVAIVRALSKDPELLLADEPTANLDSKRGHEVMELLREKAMELHKAVVVVSHDSRIRQFADRVVWLEDGRLSHDETHAV